MNRTLGVVLAAVLGIGVLAAVIVSFASSHPLATVTPQALITVHGVIGSEKKPFFDDPQVQRVFAEHGLLVVVDTAGSREIATTFDLSHYDFAFPAGIPAATKIAQSRHVNVTYQPFYSPMAVATFQPIVQLLEAAGVATAQNGYVTLDMNAYMAMVQKNERWTDLPNNTAYPAGKSILISSTDIRKSNSATMYLAIVSYVANQNNVVQDTSQAATVLPIVEPVFLRQGYTASSSEGPFLDYLSIGMGKTPMAMIYEAQFLSLAAAKDPSITPNMVLIYPNPTVLSKHTLVPLTANGDKVGQLLESDPRLQKLAAQYGFRTSNPTYFNSYMLSKGYPAAPQLINVVDPPTYEVLEAMIQEISKKYGGG